MSLSAISYLFCVNVRVVDTLAVGQQRSRNAAKPLLRRQVTQWLEQPCKLPGERKLQPPAGDCRSHPPTTQGLTFPRKVSQFTSNNGQAIVDPTRPRNTSDNGFLRHLVCTVNGWRIIAGSRLLTRARSRIVNLTVAVFLILGGIGQFFPGITV